MDEDPDAEVARLITVVADEPGLIRELSAIADRLLEVLDAKARLQSLPNARWRAGFLRRNKVRQP